MNNEHMGKNTEAQADRLALSGRRRPKVGTADGKPLT
jgi:hypothetical protein